MSSTDDITTNRQVRTVLVRHWVDLGRLSIRTVAGRCSIRGSLMLLPGTGDDLTAATVESMVSDIKRICGNAKFRIEFDNWSNYSGIWKHIALDAPSSQGAIAVRPAASQSGVTLNIDDAGEKRNQPTKSPQGSS